MKKLDKKNIKQQLKTHNVVKYQDRSYPVQTGLDNNTTVKWVDINGITISIFI